MPASEIFHKFKAGTLKSSTGQKVTNRKQAIAIAMSYGSHGHLKKKTKGRGLGK